MIGIDPRSLGINKRRSRLSEDATMHPRVKTASIHPETEESIPAMNRSHGHPLIEASGGDFITVVVALLLPRCRRRAPGAGVNNIKQMEVALANFQSIRTVHFGRRPRSLRKPAEQSWQILRSWKVRRRQRSTPLVPEYAALPRRTTARSRSSRRSTSVSRRWTTSATPNYVASLQICDVRRCKAGQVGSSRTRRKRKGTQRHANSGAIPDQPGVNTRNYCGKRCAVLRITRRLLGDDNPRRPPAVGAHRQIQTGDNT